MDPAQITKLANLLRENGDKLLNNGFSFQLTGSLLRALNDSFTLIMESASDTLSSGQTFLVLNPNNFKSPVYRDLQLIFDFVQKTTLLCIAHKAGEELYDGVIDISKFRALKRLEVQKVPIRQIVGIQPLRSQLQELICVKSLPHVEDIITCCGGDDSTGLVWNELKSADFSYNNLQTIDRSLEFAQYLQHLNLRHNRLVSVDAIRWLPHLKTLDLSYNCLQYVPVLHEKACKRLQSLNMSNNFVEDLIGVAKLDALTDLDLSDNCLLEHAYLLPLTALMTLNYLNLMENPLCCHPKHRLMTAQYLHKNSATVKFLLDAEPLSKSEKAVTGTQQLRTPFSRLSQKSSTPSIRTARKQSTDTPTSSVGSSLSYNINDTYSETETVTPDSSAARRQRSNKLRTVQIDDDDTSSEAKDEKISREYSQQNSWQKVEELETLNTEHLDTKIQVEKLRQEFGPEWLQSKNAKDSLFGKPDDNERKQNGRDLLDEYLGQFASPSMESSMVMNDTDTTNNTTVRTSTPTNDSHIHDSQAIEQTLSPIKGNEPKPSAECTASIDESYFTATENSDTDADNTEDKYKSIFSAVAEEEPHVSDVEDDERTYIVYANNSKDPIILTLSSNFLREKDTLTESTNMKWSLKQLESCEHVTLNTIRVNFDTKKISKRTRTYKIEDNLCQELLNKLRDILSQRDLSEMNQAIYRCVNCSSQFVWEMKKYALTLTDVICPNCHSTFVTEVNDHPVPQKHNNINDNLQNKCSPANIAEALALNALPLLAPTISEAEETNSIGKGAARLSAINTHRNRSLMQAKLSSANSLKESSSCSKISNSQSSFDSNQSVVGSTNTDRDNFAANCESDVDILSNPSQSSIEILDGYYNQQTRKGSTEEQQHQELIVSTEISNTSDGASNIIPTEATSKQTDEHNNKRNYVQLTESSSSGSVTDSVCTAYDQTEKQKEKEKNKNKTNTLDVATHTNLLIASESKNNNKSNNHASNNKTNTNSESEKENSTVTSVLGAIFQSTNVLMTGTKKFLDTETSGIQTGTAIKSTTSAKKSETTLSLPCTPYKFNYSDFNDIDHRLKLYFLQNKFEQEKGEHFKWIVRGRIYNESTNVVCDGLVVMSTCKIYLMEAYAPEHDDVTHWLRHLNSVTVDRLECVQLLPWKVGLAFTLRNADSFLLLLQDILRTDSLLLYFANNPLPSECELNYQISSVIQKRLNASVNAEQLTMCSLLNVCEISRSSANRTFQTCVLLTTNCNIYLTSENLAWLSLHTNPNIETDIQVCVKQAMDNLVEVERKSKEKFIIKFFDETHNIEEIWSCTFETNENAESCLNAIAQSWESLFGVALCTGSP